MTLTPTLEQSTILSFVTTSSDNLLVSALAGCAKTSTLEMIAKKLTSSPILFLAFNKRIADEAAARLPSHVEVRTLNSLGHRVWGASCGRRLIVKSQKMGDLYQEYLAPLKGEARSRAWEERSDILDLLRAAKRDGYVPPQARQIAKWQIEGDWPFDEELAPSWRRLVDDLLAKSISLAFSGQIDYDDQLYMPTCFGGQWPKFPLVLIDEAQDLSPINHEMLNQLFYRRIIAVGDPFQSIYGFRGSVSNGMTQLRQRFSMEELPLSVTFRVPQSGVVRARSRVPSYKWPEWLSNWPVGRIEKLAEWTAASLPLECAILCRNNAPLFTAALRLLSAGRKIRLVGMDIGPSLLRIIKKLEPQRDLPLAIENWMRAELARKRNEERVTDKADCLRALCTGRTSRDEAVAYAEALFKQEGGIELLSIHKAKGLEWDTVYHLDPWRIPSKWAKTEEDLEQEANLRYVGETRFKKELYLINMEDFR